MAVHTTSRTRLHLQRRPFLQQTGRQRSSLDLLPLLPSELGEHLVVGALWEPLKFLFWPGSSVHMMEGHHRQAGSRGLLWWCKKSPGPLKATDHHLSTWLPCLWRRITENLTAPWKWNMWKARQKVDYLHDYSSPIKAELDQLPQNRDFEGL